MRLQINISRLLILLGFVLVATFWIQHDTPSYLPSPNSFYTELSWDNVHDVKQISWENSQLITLLFSSNTSALKTPEFQVEDHKLHASEQYYNYLQTNKKAAFAFYYSILKDIS